jgi:hypothetical protein
VTGPVQFTPHAVRRVRALACTGLICGLGAYVLNRVLLTIVYNSSNVDLAVSLSAITDPVLAFFGVSGAAVFAVSVVVLAAASRDARAARPVRAGRDDYPTDDVELLPPAEELDLAVDDFNASYRVDFAGRWGGHERFRLGGARDVRDVIGWAHNQAEGRSFEVWVEHATAAGVAQIRLAEISADVPDN